MSKKILGRMIIAKAPCGKVAAAAWIEEFNENEIKTMIEKYEARKLVVSKVLRFENDSQPDWICYPGCKECVIK